MKIVIADDGIPFNGISLMHGPLGGAESCVIWLAEAFAELGHRVTCLTNHPSTVEHNGVNWLPLNGRHPEEADLYIANRGHRALYFMPKAKHCAFWMHNPAEYILKIRYLWPIMRRQPAMVFLSNFHKSTLPQWVPGHRMVIPHGVHPAFKPRTDTAIPGPRAVFLSNPLRGLGPLLDLWENRIIPMLPSAELHLFTGPSIMSAREAETPETRSILDKAKNVAGVVLNPPLPREDLALKLSGMRLHCYPSTVPESFCLAAAESQACGVPAVVNNTGALPERVLHGKTGFVVPANNSSEFADATYLLLSNDTVWTNMNKTLSTTLIRRWRDVACDFITLTKPRVDVLIRKDRF